MLKNIKILSIHNFIRRFRPYVPFAILYFVDLTDSYALGMAVFAVREVFRAVLELPTGLLSDHIGRRKTIILASICMFLAILLYSTAIFFWPILFVACFLEAIMYSLYSGNNNALIYETLEDENKTDDFHHHMGNIESYSHLSLGISAIIGGLLLLIFPVHYLFVITCVPSFILIIISFMIIVPRASEKTIGVKNKDRFIKSFHDVWRNKKLRFFALANTITMGISEATWQFRVTFIQMIWPVWTMGFINAADHFLSVIGYKYGGRISDRFSHKTTIISFEYFNAAINIVAVALKTVISPILMILPGVHWAARDVAMEDSFQKLYSHEARATLGSIVSFLSSLCYAIASLLIGLLADWQGIEFALISLFILQLGAIIFYGNGFKIKS